MEPDLIGQEKPSKRTRPEPCETTPQWSLTSSVRKRDELADYYEMIEEN